MDQKVVKSNKRPTLKETAASKREYTLLKSVCADRNSCIVQRQLTTCIGSVRRITQ